MQTIARLDKQDDRRILCGRQLNGRYTCQQQIALVINGAIERTDGIQERRYIGFPTGWFRRDDGVWDLTNHARGKRKSGYRPSHRRGPRHRELASPDSNQAFVNSPARLPVTVKCPECQLEQRIEHEPLQLAPYFDEYGPDSDHDAYEVVASVMSTD
jgi:hypothetical protein